jgi:hypothetical protein
MTRKEALIALRAAVKAGHCSTHLALSAIPKWSSVVMASFDGSLDAARALHEAVLPGWWWQVTVGVHHTTAKVQGDIMSGQYAEADADTPARAWLLAILEALIWEAAE